jgi:GNAT superfamily N-acetyltransferase
MDAKAEDLPTGALDPGRGERIVGSGVVIIRRYRDSDVASAGRLIAETFSEFNLSFASPEERDRFLGPFRYADSPEEAHQAAIAAAIRSETVLVAVDVGTAQDDVDEGKVVGILRGRRGRLASLFVQREYHRQGIGRRLVERFEQEHLQQGAAEVKVAATLYAVPFYLQMGYKRTTGIRSGRSFEGTGLPYQPMKKILGRE